MTVIDISHNLNPPKVGKSDSVGATSLTSSDARRWIVPVIICDTFLKLGANCAHVHICGYTYMGNSRVFLSLPVLPNESFMQK